MAQLQEYYGSCGLYPSPPQPRSRFTNSLDNSRPQHSYDNMARGTSMTPPLLQRPFRPEDHIQSTQWPVSQECIPPPMSSSSLRTQGQMWGQHPGFSGSMMWEAMQTGPLSMLDMSQPMLTNNSLLYSQDARQNALNRTGMFNGASLWPSNGMASLHHSSTAHSPASEVMPSPASQLNDAKIAYSPGLDGNQMTTGHNSASYAMAPLVMKVTSSPGFMPPTPQPDSIFTLQAESAFVQDSFGSAMSTATGFHLDNIVTDSISTPTDSEHSYEQSQSGSPGLRSWYPPGYHAGKSAMSHSVRNHQLATPPNGRDLNSSLAFVDRSMRQRQPQWSNKGSGVPTQTHFQTRFMAPSTADEKARRTSDDETLLQMKQDGYTYKDIRKALRCKVAESTLRGRYRSLTKPRKERVRAPKWTEIDIKLLKRCVQDEFDKLDVTHPSLETKHKPDKVPWMKVVETIASTGGTYKFGAATAKKKWAEVVRAAPSRSSRRRSRAG